MKARTKTATIVLYEPARPICSLCGKPAKDVVTFTARSSRDGAPVMNRGAARTVRLCRPCACEVVRAFPGHRPATYRKRPPSHPTPGSR